MSGTPLDILRSRIGKTVAKHVKDYQKRFKNARLDEKLFRDPIFGFQRLRPYEVLIVDSPLFQRLRGIFQTSVAYLTYPSSIHTRFEHSINCLNLAEEVLQALSKTAYQIDVTDWAEVRLAALLHDIGHCIFSHGSEFFYRDFPEFGKALKDSEINSATITESELVNYCIITSQPFRDFVWEPIKEICRRTGDMGYIDHIKLEKVAQMIIGMPPNDEAERRYQTDIVNGPMDVDKLDYLTRDAYFTGISIRVGIDRLMPSLRVETVNNEERARYENRLVVDYRGIVVVEQLLFARMVLYDTVYHHHKVRAANAFLQQVLKKHYRRPVWPTESKRLATIADLLEIDEYEFYGHSYKDEELREQIWKLRTRVLPERALVLTARALVDRKSHIKWSSNSADYVGRDDVIGVKKGRRFFDKVRSKIIAYARQAGAKGLSEEDVHFDIPEPPKYGRLGDETLVHIGPECIVRLRDLFPFQKVVNNYSTQYKYRSYVFTCDKWRQEVAYAAVRALRDVGIRVNDLALILAHHQPGDRTYTLLSEKRIRPPDWRVNFYSPDANLRKKAVGDG